MADLSITFTQLLTILGLVLGIVSFLAGVVWNIWKKVIENGKNLDTYKLEVAERYVKTEQMVEMEKQMAVREERLHGSIGNLTTRIDRILDRLDRT